MKRVLLLEDDATLGKSLNERLSKDYAVDWLKSVKEARAHLTDQRYDLAILDVGLPDGSGFDVAQEIRTNSPATLFIFLTAQADAESRLRGFELGAEEFIPKPFFLKELLLRVKHVLDIHTPKQEVRLKEFTIDFTDMSIRHASGKIDYPPLTEMKVLEVLVHKSPQPVSRDDIFDYVWGKDKTPNLRSVDNIIVKLRQLLGDGEGQRIRSVRGLGYQWAPAISTDSNSTGEVTE